MCFAGSLFWVRAFSSFLVEFRIRIAELLSRVNASQAFVAPFDDQQSVCPASAGREAVAAAICQWPSGGMRDATRQLF